MSYSLSSVSPRWESFSLNPKYRLIGIQFRRALGQKEDSEPTPMRSNPCPYLLRAMKRGLVYD
jgi:hypothetical protein